MNAQERDTPFESSVPFDAGRIRAAALYCSDGRFGEQCDDLLQNSLHLPRYDRLAVPGGAACFTSHASTYNETESVMGQLRFLVEAHQLERVVLIAHQNCAFYLERLRVSPEQLKSHQLQDIQKAVRLVRSLSEGLLVEAFFAAIHEDRAVHFEPVDV